MMPPMTTPGSLVRLLAVVLVVMLTVTLAAPARAEADVLTLLAITSLVIAGVVIIAYLVIANVEGSRRADTGHAVRLACARPGCPVPAGEPPPAEDAVQAP